MIYETCCGCRCFNPGTLVIGTHRFVEDPDTSGALAAYNFSTPENLGRRAAEYDRVRRPNGRLVQGVRYTARMAEKDFQAVAHPEGRA
jgi:hypothetical protein